MKKSLSFWDFIEEDKGVSRTIIRNPGMRMHNLTLHFHKGVWKYTFISKIGFVTCADTQGHVVLDIHRKTLVLHTVKRDMWRRNSSSSSMSFRYIISLFFEDATMFFALPTLKSISLTSLKTK